MNSKSHHKESEPLQHPAGNQYMYIVGQLLTRDDLLNNEEPADDQRDIEYIFDLAQKIVDTAKRRRHSYLKARKEQRFERALSQG